MKYKLTLLIMSVVLNLSAQQTWQWAKAGGSSSDNNGVQPAECKIAGCDAYGNIYAVGGINGPNMKFDTFSSAGSYSGTGAGISYLLFSYDCAGNMRWAKEIGDEEGDAIFYGAVTDPQGNTYLAANFWYGYYGGVVKLFLGDSVLIPTPPVITQPYLCMVKFDSLGKLVWFKNYEEDTAYAPHVGSLQTFAYGLRIGSSGNLWMGCNLDSDYAMSPNLHTALKGLYNVEVDPNTGSILGGYYTSNSFFGDIYSLDTYWDLDENENYYETGTLNSQLGDTLILANQSIAPAGTLELAYIFSLDKQGNFRYIINNKNYATQASFRSCKYDFLTDRLVASWDLDSGNVYGNDTFVVHSANMPYGQSSSGGLFSIASDGNILWGKYITKIIGMGGSFTTYTPTPYYFDGEASNGICIYNNSDTIYDVDTSAPSTDYYQQISEMDANGNLITTHTAHMGYIGTGINYLKYGATDWRGNVYLGGTVSNFFATPADSVVNTDTQSGSFLIAKLGISDCSCPTPGVQFTETTHGDTVIFYGSSINHNDSIHWEFGDGAVSNSDTFTHIYTHDSTYTVTAIAYSGCGIDSITRQITISCTLPVVSFTLSSHIDTAVFYATTTNNDSILWSFGDGSTGHGDTSNHVYSQNGTYTVTATAYSPCGADSATKQVVVSGLGITAIDVNKTSLYPNPIQNTANLSLSGPATIGLIYANGASVWSSSIQVNQQGTYVFDMSRYACAVYYFIVQYPNGKTDVMQAVKE